VNLLKKIASAATSGIGALAFDVAKTYFPPDMSEGEKAALKAELMNLELQKQRDADAATQEASEAMTKRIGELEGTAKDIKAIPILGPLVLFLRGCQRPLWGFATLWLDFQWFATWSLNEQQQTALIVINFLVLGFLFGERAMQNVLPLLVQVFSARSGKKDGL